LPNILKPSRVRHPHKKMTYPHIIV
jgi:hypothetical protein